MRALVTLTLVIALAGCGRDQAPGAAARRFNADEAKRQAVRATTIGVQKRPTHDLSAYGRVATTINARGETAPASSPTPQGQNLGQGYLRVPATAAPTTSSRPKLSPTPQSTAAATHVLPDARTRKVSPQSVKEAIAAAERRRLLVERRQAASFQAQAKARNTRIRQADAKAVAAFRRHPTWKVTPVKGGAPKPAASPTPTSRR